MRSLINLLKIILFPLLLFILISAVLAILGKLEWSRVFQLAVVYITIISLFLERREVNREIINLGGMEKKYSVLTQNLSSAILTSRFIKLLMIV